MNKHEENLLSMFNAVDVLLQENSSTIEAIPMITTSHEKFTGVINDIRNKDNELNSVAAGKTAGKENAEDDMIDAIIPVTSVIYAYAKINNLEDLKAVVKVTPSSLKLLRDNDLLNRAKFINDKVAELITELVDYGITEEILSQLNSKVQAYIDALADKETGFAERSAARKNLSSLFDKANEILKEELDNLMELFRESNIDFYNQYISARVIKDLGVTKSKEEPAEE
ncbi:MAG: hypothetical protein PVH88_05115 [Ignavibacteria bacterium]|jgi:prefoldin subunit 5